jgi:hypothetical protein
MRGIGKPSQNTGRAVAALFVTLSLGAPAAAQDTDPVSTYRLPEPGKTPTPRVLGPVDTDNPLSLPSRADPQPAPQITPAPPPRVILPPATPPRTAETRRERQPTARPSSEPIPDTGATAPAPVTPAARREVQPGFDTLPSSAPATEPATTPASSAAASSPYWLIPGLIALLVIAAAAFFVLRRRRDAAGEPDDEAQVVEAPAPVPAPPPASPAPTQPIRTQQAPATLISEPLTIATTFIARAVRLSLVYATVQYELEIANTGSIDLPSLEMRADLASAHASLGTREQLAPPPAQLEAARTLEPLAPGVTMTIKGEARIPLQHVRVVTKGTAQFFVPLVRFAILAPDGTGIRRVYTVGPLNPDGGTIASVRLDAGPRNLRDLASREIEAARGFALDPEVAHS